MLTLQAICGGQSHIWFGICDVIWETRRMSQSDILRNGLK